MSNEMPFVDSSTAKGYRAEVGRSNEGRNRQIESGSTAMLFIESLAGAVKLQMPLIDCWKKGV